MSSDKHRRKKIYLGSTDKDEKADDTLLVRKLIKAVYEKGLQRVNEGNPLPDSFVDLFGAEATITSAARYLDPDAFRFASKGGAISNREQLLLNLLSGKMEATLSSTDTIKESILADVHCVSAVENPIDLIKNNKADGAD